MQSREQNSRGDFRDAREYYTEGYKPEIARQQYYGGPSTNPMGLDPRSGTEMSDLQYKANQLKSGGIDSEKVAANIALGLRDLEQRQAERQAAYQAEIARQSDPFAAKIAQERERKLIDQLYARAMGRQENIGDIEARILANQAASGFQRSLGPQGSSVNPLLQARAAQQAAGGTLAGSEMSAAQRRLQGMLSEGEQALSSLGAISNRDLQVQDALRELRFGEQRELEGLQSQMAKNVNQRALAQIQEQNARAAAQREEDKAYALAGLNLIGALGAAGIDSLSDERTKKKVTDGKNTIDVILETVGPVEYEYKERYKDSNGAGRGRHLGVMAQDLEDAGVTGVIQIDPVTGMKVIDTVKMIPLLLAAQSRLNEKIDESKSNGNKKEGSKKK